MLHFLLTTPISSYPDILNLSDPSNQLQTIVNNFLSNFFLFPVVPTFPNLPEKQLRENQYLNIFHSSEISKRAIYLTFKKKPESDILEFRNINKRPLFQNIKSILELFRTKNTYNGFSSVLSPKKFLDDYLYTKIHRCFHSNVRIRIKRSVIISI